MVVISKYTTTVSGTCHVHNYEIALCILEFSYFDYSSEGDEDRV